MALSCVVRSARGDRAKRSSASSRLYLDRFSCQNPSSPRRHSSPEALWARSLAYSPRSRNAHRPPPAARRPPRPAARPPALPLAPVAILCGEIGCCITRILGIMGSLYRRRRGRTSTPSSLLPLKAAPRDQTPHPPPQTPSPSCFCSESTLPTDHEPRATAAAISALRSYHPSIPVRPTLALMALDLPA